MITDPEDSLEKSTAVPRIITDVLSGSPQEPRISI